MAPLVGNTLQRRDHLALSSRASLCHPERSEGSLAGQRSFAALRACPRAKRRDDKPEAAAFDSQNVLFEMYCPWWGIRKCSGTPGGCQGLAPLVGAKTRVLDNPGPGSLDNNVSFSSRAE